MPCYHPIVMKQLHKRNAKGAKPIVSCTDIRDGKNIRLPCGRCNGCRLEYARQWAIRCVNEMEYWKRNSFITLTYADDALTYGGAEHGILVPRDLTLFWKRLRKEGPRFRYFACGEYGDKFNRPHYHSIIFGYDFPDKVYKNTENGNHYYTSPSLNRIWGHGDCIVGNASFESASYVARYVMKKRNGPEAEYYRENGITPEFVAMSRRPGIGSMYYDDNESDMFPRDNMCVRNHGTVPPKYYSNKYRERSRSLLVPNIQPMDFEDMIERRQERAERHWQDNEPKRLKVRERIKLSAIRNLKRKL